MRKLLALHLLFGLFIFCSATPMASAHTLDVDGDIGVTLHVHPNDEPLVGTPTPFYIDITQRGQEFKTINCECSLTISRDRDNETVAVLTVKYLAIPNYVFTEKGLYTIRIVGRPIGAADFKPFEARFSYYVRPPQGLTAKSIQNNSLQSLFPYVTLAISLIILCIILIPLELNRKGNK